MLTGRRKGKAFTDVARKDTKAFVANVSHVMIFAANYSVCVDVFSSHCCSY